MRNWKKVYFGIICLAISAWSFSNNFLGLSTSGHIMEAAKKFGSPYALENIKDTDGIICKFKRDNYELQITINAKSEIQTIAAFGFNKAVKYKGIRLGDTFGNIIIKSGRPESYEINNDNVKLIYKDCIYVLSKISKNKYQVVGIIVHR